MSILQDLNKDQVINFVEEILQGKCVTREGYNNNAIFESFCHGSTSPKLYYNEDTHNFYCFSHCGAINSLADLTMKIKECDFKEAMNIINSYFGVNGKYHRHGVGRKSRNRPQRREIDIDKLEVPSLPKQKKPFAYRRFPIKRLPIWEDEGITFRTLKKYDIRYDEIGEKIIIPHFAWDTGEIVGVRVRNLDKEVAEKFGKYVPFYFKGQMYSHSLKYNLYGYWQNKESIKKMKVAVLFEGEKGTMQLNSYLKDNNSVAVCGSNLSYEQIKMLISLGVEEIVFAFDKQYENKQEELQWRAKIMKLAYRIPPSVKVSVIWDSLENGLLDYKDSPTDKGKEIYLELFNDRIDFKDFEVVI